MTSSSQTSKRLSSSYNLARHWGHILKPITLSWWTLLKPSTQRWKPYYWSTLPKSKICQRGRLWAGPQPQLALAEATQASLTPLALQVKKFRHGGYEDPREDDRSGLTIQVCRYHDSVKFTFGCCDFNWNYLYWHIGIRRAMSSGNLEELDIIWQPQIKASMKSYLNLFPLLFRIIPFIIFSIIYNRKELRKQVSRDLQVWRVSINVRNKGGKCCSQTLVWLPVKIARHTQVQDFLGRIIQFGLKKCFQLK